MLIKTGAIDEAVEHASLLALIFERSTPKVLQYFDDDLSHWGQLMNRLIEVINLALTM